MEDPENNDAAVDNSVSNVIFLYIYTIEAGLKIGALGLVIPRGSYLRDRANILDAIIVATG